MSCTQVISLWTAASGTVGMPLWKAALPSVFRGLGLGPDRLAVIRHATAFDDQLARACIQMIPEKTKSTNLLIHRYCNNPEASGRARDHLPGHQEQVAQCH